MIGSGGYRKLAVSWNVSRKVGKGSLKRESGGWYRCHCYMHD